MLKRYLTKAIIALLIVGCSKSEFLDKNPNQSHVVPGTIEELRAILDNDQVMNGMGSAAARGPVPHLGEAGADDYYVIEQRYPNIITQYRNYYIWAKDVYDGTIVYDWDRVFETVFYANVVLDGLKAVDRNEANSMAYDEVFGGALFFRSYAFYQLAQVFAPPYQSNTASSNWGIPLRLSADLNEKLERATLADTYSRIIDDLVEAKDLLPHTPAIKTRPSKQAVYALLARIYLIMQDYGKAGLYADSCLRIRGDLLDYNQLDESATYPFREIGLDNPEIIFASNTQGGTTYLTFRNNVRITDELVGMYDDGDLRQQVFFLGTATGYQFKGDYTGGTGFGYAGLTTDEIYLIRAECHARMSNEEEAHNDLNRLLRHRWREGDIFEPINIDSPDALLVKILEERRKELVFRGTRWTDLRRLNVEGHNITISRTIDGQTYVLPPNDLRYTYPIPDEVMAFRAGWPQNER